MVFSLQPDIVVNDRNGLPGDFSKIQADSRAWETCDTMNLGWGYQKNDTEWKSAKRIVNDLTSCAQQGGNYLLNIGPMADGSVPEESVRVLDQVGAWLRTNGGHQSALATTTTSRATETPSTSTSTSGPQARRPPRGSASTNPLRSLPSAGSRPKCSPCASSKPVSLFSSRMTRQHFASLDCLPSHPTIR